LTPDLGHAEFGTAGEARRSTIMARKNYTDEFRRQAVDLYRSTPGCGCPKLRTQPVTCSFVRPR
jgi:hypothetical protein